MSAADDLLQLLRAAHNPVKSTAEPAETEEVSRLSRKRKRDDEHGTLKNKLREELLRKQAQAKESDPKGSWLRSFVHNTWKNTKKRIRLLSNGNVASVITCSERPRLTIQTMAPLLLLPWGQPMVRTTRRS